MLPPTHCAAAPDADDPLNFSALALAAQFRAGTLSPIEHTERVLERARTRGAQVGAFAHLAPEFSRAQAAHAEAAYKHGSARPLTGVPFPIKDLTEVAGLPFEAGSLALRGFVSENSDGVVQRALDAGTVTIGKTTTSEFGMSVFSESPASAPARTPWDLRRSAGGSSGGAGAAVGANIVPFAHGNDAGGSVRVPAACTGVVGMMTGRGLISWGPYGTDGSGLPRHGVLARTVADVAAGIDMLAFSQPGDYFPRERKPTRARPASKNTGLLHAVQAATRACASGNVEPVRIGVITTPMVAETDLHPEALAAVDRACAVFRSLGHSVLPLDPPVTPKDWQSFMPIWAVGAACIPIPPQLEDQVGALTRWLRGIGRQTSGVDYGAALTRIQQLTRHMAAEWAEVDAIVTPMTSAPPPIAESIPTDPAEDFAFQSRFTPFTSVWNMNGFAAMSVPLHRATIDGVELPFGVHLAGTGPWQEALLLTLAAQLEAADPWPFP